MAGRSSEDKGVGMVDEVNEGIANIAVDGDYEPRRREQWATQQTDAAQMGPQLIAEAETIQIHVRREGER